MIRNGKHKAIQIKSPIYDNSKPLTPPPTYDESSYDALTDNNDNSQTLVLESIEDDEKIKHTGDVIVKNNIGKKVKIHITDGSLTIYGNVNSGVHITQAVTSKASHLHKKFEINISGTLATSAHLHAAKADIKVSNVQQRTSISTVHGNIVAKNVGEYTSLYTEHGDITVRHIENHVTIETCHGDITCHDAGNNTVITTDNGDIKTEDVGVGSELTSNHGDINCKNVGEKVFIYLHHGKVRVLRDSKTTKYDIKDGTLYINGKEVVDKSKRLDDHSNPHSSCERTSIRVEDSGNCFIEYDGESKPDDETKEDSHFDLMTSALNQYGLFFDKVMNGGGNSTATYKNSGNITFISRRM